MAYDEKVDETVSVVGRVDDGESKSVVVRLVRYAGGPVKVAVCHEGKGERCWVSRLGRMAPETGAQLAAILTRANQLAAEMSGGRRPRPSREARP